MTTSWKEGWYQEKQKRQGAVPWREWLHRQILAVRNHHMGGIDIVTVAYIQPVSMGATRKIAGEISGDFHAGCPPNAFRIYRILSPLTHIDGDILTANDVVV
jgi:hypothetical protein